MDTQTALDTLLVVAVVSALAPFVVAMFGRVRLPQVVVLIVGGVIVGPEVLGWADPASVGLLADVGLGFLFLMAGYELELGAVHPARRPARHPCVVRDGRSGGRGDRPAGLHRPGPRLRAGRAGTDHDRLRRPAADPAGQRHARRTVRVVHHACRSGRGVPADRGDRHLPQRERQVPGAAVAGGDAARGAAPDRPAPTHVPGPFRVHHQPDGALDVPDDAAPDRHPAVRAARRGLRVRPRRRARGLPRGRGPEEVGAGRRPLPGDQARRGRLRVLHPGLLRGVGDEPRPDVDRGGATAARSPSSSCSSWCEACPRSSSTVATST